jgi:predicted transcriptional regulator
MTEQQQSTARPNVSIRLGSSGLGRVDALADETGSDRSKVIRALLAEALADLNVMRRARARLLAWKEAGL